MRPSLRSCVLIAEDQYFLADDLAQMNRDGNVDVVGPFATVAEAQPSASAPRTLTAAILNIDLTGEKIWPVLDTLINRAVPVVLATGYDGAVLPSRYAHIPRATKPISDAAVRASPVR